MYHKVISLDGVRVNIRLKVSFSLLLLLSHRFTASLISWGTSFHAPFLGGNIYVSVVISSLTVVPAYPIMAGLTLK